MWVTHISLTNVRNHQSSELSFNQGFNLLLGANGQGKTNVVEAIAYFASLSSHRTSSDASLIRAQCDSAVLRMRVRRAERDILLELLLNRQGSNRAQINGNSVKPRELPHYFSCIVFAPEDLQIIRGEPTVRRKFLDTFLTARDPQFSSVLDEYERVVRQRTSLLKSARQRQLSRSNDLPQTLEVWNEKLVSLGTKIIVERVRALHALAAPVRQFYERLVDADHAPELRIKSSVFEEEENPLSPDVSIQTITAAFQAGLRRVQQDELDRGLTLVGPHRDDLLCFLNGLPVKGFASHGETWSFILALRLATAEVLTSESTAGDPVIILDDVFAELDARRRTRLLAAITPFEQVIVTAAVESDVPEMGEWKTIRIHNGAVVS